MSTTAPATAFDALERVLAAAVAAAPVLADVHPSLRADALDRLADELDSSTDELVAVAAEETALPVARLTGEVARTTAQLRMFGRALTEGSWLDAIIDTADPTAAPVPRPDLRRMQLPVGPVLVFAAGNFPFAFSVAGGDTASALAAGCPVVVKEHPGHPRTSAQVASIVARTLDAVGLPAGSFALVGGEVAAVAALRDRRIRAASFTGSLSGGRALSDIAASREVPIPFYAEMGSLNPVFVSPGAVAARAASIVDGYVASFTLGVGQLCTKPGLLFLPSGHGLADQLVEAVREVPPGRMLMERIRTGHQRVRDALGARPGVRSLVPADLEPDAADQTAPALFETDVDTLVHDGEAVLTECFGPTSIVVEYADTDDAVTAARRLDGTLTATVHAEPPEAEFAGRLLAELQQRAGRVVWNGWPTGVSVSWGMHHGGPYPATTHAAHTSVGMTAMRRFLRPICYQDLPQDLLPVALRDHNTGPLLRRLDGRLTTDDVTGTRPE